MAVKYTTYRKSKTEEADKQPHEKQAGSPDLKQRVFFFSKSMPKPDSGLSVGSGDMGRKYPTMGHIRVLVAIFLHAFKNASPLQLFILGLLN